MQVRSALVLPRERWDLRERSNCWDRRAPEVTGLALEIGKVWANDRVRGIVARQARFRPKGQAWASVLVSETGLVWETDRV